jgi:hypothetical protein
MPIFPALAFQSPNMRHALPLLLLFLPLMTGCDQLSERLGMPNPAKILAEGKAVGGACRHAGRGLEDCYQLNPRADKAAVYEGWKEMNEYMAKNNMQAVPPSLAEEDAKHKSSKRDSESDEDADKEEHAGDEEQPRADGETKPDSRKAPDKKAGHKEEDQGGH